MQGNHEEIEILLQKHLISSGFNQKLSLKKREHRFVEISSQKCVSSDSLKKIWMDMMRPCRA